MQSKYEYTLIGQHVEVSCNISHENPQKSKESDFGITFQRRVCKYTDHFKNLNQLGQI